MADEPPKLPSVAALEAEERLAQLSDQAARFAELVAAGAPVEEAFARAGFTEGSAHALATRHDVLAAVSAVRERNLGDGPTDVVYLRRLLHGAAYFAFRDQDVRAVTATVRLLAELDGHLEKKPAPGPGAGDVSIQINLGPVYARGADGAIVLDAGGNPVIEVTPTVSALPGPAVPSDGPAGQGARPHRPPSRSRAPRGGAA